MFNIEHLKADFKQVTRDPVITAVMFAPFLIIAVIKAAAVFLFPFILERTGFNIFDYYGYVLTAGYFMVPAMLGTVMAFLMIDERDGKVAELMAITPAGYSGYVFNRLFMPCVLTVLYTIIGYFVLDGGIETSFPAALYLALLGGVEAVVIGLVIFRVADDKVKGIAYSKGLSLFELAAFADLFDMPWFSIVSSLLPFYWIARLINNGFGIVNIILAGLVHALWIFIAYLSSGRQRF